MAAHHRTAVPLAVAPASRGFGRAAALRCWMLAWLGLAACADPSGTLIIVQNQVPTVDEMTHACVVSADDSKFSLTVGVYDVDLDRPYPYFVYPLVQNRFPSVKTSSGVERNSLRLDRVLVSIKAPAGVDPGWAAGCPGDFSSPANGLMDPGSARAVPIQGFQACHAQRIRELIAASAIPGDLTQPVYFRVELRAVAYRGGAEQTSPVFPFDVQVCAGCLQSMFPLTPACADAPKPNPLHGNVCNLAQDGPPVLCCTTPAGDLVCPAPDA